jgi:hypothetical protein
MNLTSKRMLQFLSVCAGAFALTASAQTTWVSDNFEKEGAGLTNASPGDAAGMYKAHVWGAMDQWTNLVWEAGAGDASTIQEVDSTYLGNSRPIADDNAKLQALKLETEGQTLTRYVAFQNITDGTDTAGIPLTAPTNIPFATTPVYVDTLIKFTPSEDDPEVVDDGLIKFAIFVNANSNLVVHHVCLIDGGLFTTNSVFEKLTVDGLPTIINPEAWYRLTFKLALVDGLSCAEIWLDGTKLTHYNGFQDINGSHNNGSFFIALSYDHVQLSQISFQGTGYVDDLVVTDTIVPFQTAGLTLTLAFNGDLMSVTANGVAVASGGSVTDGATLVIDAIDWYQINGVTGDNISFTGTPTPGSLVNCTTGTISTTVSGSEATINVGQYTGTIPTGLGGTYATVDAGKLAAWAVNSGLTEAQVIANAADYLDNYLMNVGVDVDTGIEITSIVYDATTEKATITVEAVSPAVNFKSINGELVVWTTDNLGTAFGQAEETEFSFTIDNPGEVVTFTVDATAGSFIRARVQ